MAQAREPIRILLIDDRALFRDGLKKILVVTEGFVVIGEADEAQQVSKIADERPDVVLLHIPVPGNDVTAAVRHLRTVVPESRVIILGMDDCASLLHDLLSLGISGYLKNATRDELVTAVQRVHDHREHIVLSLSRSALAQPPVRAERPRLSSREREVLALTSRALSNSQIARRLFLTEASVKRHLRNVFAKLGAVSRIDAVNKAVAAEIIPPPAWASAGMADEGR